MSDDEDIIDVSEDDYKIHDVSEDEKSKIKNLFSRKFGELSRRDLFKKIDEYKWPILGGAVASLISTNAGLYIIRELFSEDMPDLPRNELRKYSLHLDRVYLYWIKSRRDREWYIVIDGHIESEDSYQTPRTIVVLGHKRPFKKVMRLKNMLEKGGRITLNGEHLKAYIHKGERRFVYPAYNVEIDGINASRYLK